MAKVSDVTVSATWYRFTRYAIVGGHVVAAPPFKLEKYSLLEEIQASRTEKTRAGKPGPHEEFANLDVRDEKAVLDWYTRWGSLGLLPHYLKWADFQGNGVTWVPNTDSDPSQYPWIPTFRDSSRMPRSNEEASSCMREGKPPGTVVHSGGRRGWGGSWEISTADEFFSQYFPEHFDGEGYPLPITDLFWAHYGESLKDISYHATKLRNVLRDLERLAAVDDWTREIDQETENSVRSARHFIRTCADLRPELSLWGEGGEAERKVELRTPTLWSALATLVWLDWGEGRKVATCKACNKLFITSLDSKDYCTPTCKKTAEMRRYREKKKSGSKG